MHHFKKHESWFIFFGSLALFLYGLFNRELIGHEVPFKIFTQEMLHFGPSLFGTLYGTPYAETPATLSILSYLLALTFGKLTSLIMILPCALASSLSLLLIYRLALATDQTWARISVLLALFTYQFFDTARSVSIAPFMMLSSILAFYQCSIHTQKKYLYLPLLLGCLMQGPLGIITTATAAWAFYIANGNWPQLKHYTLYVLSTFIITCLLLVIIATDQFGWHFAGHALYAQLFAPIAKANVLSDLGSLFVNYAVISFLALGSILLFFQSSQIKNKIFYALLIWLILNFAILGLTTNQHQLYLLLPMTPALALLAGSLWLNQSKLAKITVLIFEMLCLAIPFIALCLTIATIATMHLKNLSVNAHYFSAFCTLSLFALASLYIFFNHPIRYAKTHAKSVIGIGLASFIATMIFVVKPIEVSLQQSKPFTVQILMALTPKQTICFLHMKPTQEPLLFFAALEENKTVTFAFAKEDHCQTEKNALYLTPEKFFDGLTEDEKQKITVIEKGQLGYHEVVAFTRM